MLARWRLESRWIGIQTHSEAMPQLVCTVIPLLAIKPVNQISEHCSIDKQVVCLDQNEDVFLTSNGFCNTEV